MAKFKISTPRDPDLYPLRIHEISVQIDDEVRKGDTLATFELMDGSKVRMPSPLDGIIRQIEKSGRIYMDREEIAFIEQLSIAETQPREKPKAKAQVDTGSSPLPLWKSSLSVDQVDLVERAFRQAFGSACDGDPQIHPADRAVSAGVAFGEILDFEKSAYSCVHQQDSSPTDIAIWRASHYRELCRRDGYEIKAFVDTKTSERSIFLIPAFLGPVIDCLTEFGAFKFFNLYALEEGMKKRPQTFEEAWDYVLPDARQLRTICASHSPNFDSGENRKAMAFGTSELERVLVRGFSDNKSASTALWSAYSLLVKEKLSQDIPAERPVDLHPVDFIARHGKALGSWQRDAALEQAKSSLNERAKIAGLLPTQYLTAAYAKHLEKGELSGAAKLWTRFRYPTIVGAPLLLAAAVIIAPDAFDRFFEELIDVAGNATHVISRPSKEVAVPAKSSPVEWTAQTPLSFYEPPSLKEIDNGRKPRPSEATQVAFKAWLED